MSGGEGEEEERMERKRRGWRGETGGWWLQRPDDGPAQGRWTKKKGASIAYRAKY